MTYRRFVILGVLMILAFSVALVVNAQELNETTTANATDTGIAGIVGTIMTNPQTGTVMLIEFLLGFGLGYTAVKALRYILAFIGILLLGSALSVWSIGANSAEIAEKIGMEVKQLLPLLKGLMTVFGTIVVGPASVGVLVGIIVASIKK
ncbi:MAG: hypothetical protein GSR77_08090 [Desulfurococcales archaeon]|nr:hypothetical protein [Desulfurococcales archaeon]